MWRAWVLVAITGCSQPVLHNAPRPNPAAVAGGAAAVAGAATLAAPDAQARRAAEANKPAANNKPVKSGPSVPADVLDRLDHTDASGSGQGSAQQPQPPMTWQPAPQ